MEYFQQVLHTQIFCACANLSRLSTPLLSSASDGRGEKAKLEALEKARVERMSNQVLLVKSDSNIASEL